MAHQMAFKHITFLASGTGTTPNDIVFAFKPQILNSLELGPVGDDNDLCDSDFFQAFPNHSYLNK